MEESVGQCEAIKRVPEKTTGGLSKSREQLQGLEDFYAESVAQCEEIKRVPEKTTGRLYKSREQLQGLEEFYTDNKYPTESLRAEIAFRLNLTEKQVTGWFCHRRLKDKRLLLEELQAPKRQELSSVVIQDRASGLKQDSCSTTKQADHKRADLREVESRRFCHENLPAAEVNYHQQKIGDGIEMDDTSSESNSARHERFYPPNRRNTAVENRAPNEFSQHNGGRVGPSGYLKIKGQTENAAITAVKRQLGRHYREDGPSLGIEFDPLPPEAFELPCRNINDYAYGVPEPIGFGPHDGFHKHPGHSIELSEKMYEARRPKQKPRFLNHNYCFPDPKYSLGIDSYSAREKSNYNSNGNLSFQHKQDLPGMRSNSQFDYPPHSYGGNNVSKPMNTFLPIYDHVNPKVRQREQFLFKPPASAVRYKDPVCKEDRIPPNMIMKVVTKRGREEVSEENYPIRKLPHDASMWSKPIKGPTQIPSSFSEDETAETSSSMES
ncbi:hypothetical protein vseg_021671 [Gypsophila vaccaria]